MQTEKIQSSYTQATKNCLILPVKVFFLTNARENQQIFQDWQQSGASMSANGYMPIDYLTPFTAREAQAVITIYLITAIQNNLGLTICC